MIENALEKLRGIDRWPETLATVTVYEIVSEGGYEKGPPSARLTFFYRDHDNQLQSGEMIVDSFTSLYNISVGDTFPIQFNPKRASKFYTSEARSLFTSWHLLFLLLLGLIALGILAILLF